MSAHEPSDPPAGIPLKAHVEELRRRCEAVSRLQGGSTYFHEELGIFRAYIEESGLHLAEPPRELSSPPDDEGNEHQIWYLPDTRCVLKATWPDFFGLLVIHRQTEEHRASPIAYLERWQLHNEVFGDDVAFLGVISTDQGLRLLIRQTAIEGEPATLDQIQDFFTSSGWKPFMVGGNLAFFDPQREIVISDTHRGNIILMPDGLLAPIDLRVQPVSGALLDTVIKLTSSFLP
jgi:hypothetical protein